MPPNDVPDSYRVNPPVKSRFTRQVWQYRNKKH